MAVDKKGTKQIAANKRHGMTTLSRKSMKRASELAGTEVKSIRLGQINLKDSYCSFKDGEIFVRGMHIRRMKRATSSIKDPLRVRKLLMHKREIVNLFSKTKQDGYSVIGWRFISKLAREGKSVCARAKSCT